MNTQGYRKVLVKTWILKYQGREDYIGNLFEVERWYKANVKDYLNLYKAVGDAWGWAGRLRLTNSELKKIIHSETNEIYLFKDKGEIKGFFEIDKSVNGKAEIVYLGLLPYEIGKGYGKPFLEAAIVYAGKGKRQVWLHTCEYDHPKALSIYLKAGFIIESESIEKEYYPIEFLDKYNNSNL